MHIYFVIKSTHHYTDTDGNKEDEYAQGYEEPYKPGGEVRRAAHWFRGIHYQTYCADVTSGNIFIWYNHCTNIMYYCEYMWSHGV